MKQFIKDKYVVIPTDKIDENGVVDINPEAKYFVLRVDTDPLARKALNTYILELFKAGEHYFAQQLNDWALSFPHIDDRDKITLSGRCPVCTEPNPSGVQKLKKIDGVDRVIDSYFVCQKCGVMLKFLI